MISWLQGPCWGQQRGLAKACPSPPVSQLLCSRIRYVQHTDYIVPKYGLTCAYLHSWRGEATERAYPDRRRAVACFCVPARVMPAGQPAQGVTKKMRCPINTMRPGVRMPSSSRTAGKGFRAKDVRTLAVCGHGCQVIPPPSFATVPLVGNTAAEKQASVLGLDERGGRATGGRLAKPGPSGSTSNRDVGNPGWSLFAMRGPAHSGG